MARLFKNNAKKNTPVKKSSPGDEKALLNKWMANDYKFKEQNKTVEPVELDEEFQPEETIVGPKDPRIDTGLLKKRIADKIKNMEPPK